MIWVAIAVVLVGLALKVSHDERAYKHAVIAERARFERAVRQRAGDRGGRHV